MKNMTRALVALLSLLAFRCAPAPAWASGLGGIPLTSGRVSVTDASLAAGTATTRLGDGYGFGVEMTPNDEMRVVVPYRLVGAGFSGGGATVDNNFWTTTVTGSGAVSQGNAQVVLSSGATNPSTAILQSARTARYIGGSSNGYRGIVQLPTTGNANAIRRWGAYSATSGAFFEHNGSTLSVVTRRAGVDTAVASGSWNGSSSFTIDTSVHTYEIYYNNRRVYFVADGTLRHTMVASTATWSDTTNLPVRAEVVSTQTDNVAIQIRSNVIRRFGSPITQPISKYQTGTTAGLVLKNGAGNILSIAISGVATNAAVSLFDNTAASGTIVWASGAMAQNTTPFYIDLKGAPFFNGLTLVISGAAASATVIYE